MAILSGEVTFAYARLSLIAIGPMLLNAVAAKTNAMARETKDLNVIPGVFNVFIAIPRTYVLGFKN